MAFFGQVNLITGCENCMGVSVSEILQSSVIFLLVNVTFGRFQICWVALTATANRNTQEDIVQELQLKNVRMFKTPTFRENLFYDVIMKDLITVTPEV